MDSPLWQTEITVSWAGTDRIVPLTNWAGRCYPSFPGGDEFLARVLDITPEDHVLDVGGGAEPFHYASVVCERDLRGTDQRAGRSAKLDRRFVAGDAQALPFPSASFNFAFSRHVLEHVADPKAACTEMMRVAARGYIETPCALSEYLVGDPTHRWLVRADDRTLIFTPRPFVEHPFGNVLRWLLHADSELFFQWEMAYRNLTNTQFYWEETFRRRCRTGGDDRLSACRSGPTPAVVRRLCAEWSCPRLCEHRGRYCRHQVRPGVSARPSGRPTTGGIRLPTALRRGHPSR